MYSVPPPVVSGKTHILKIKVTSVFSRDIVLCVSFNITVYDKNPNRVVVLTYIGYLQRNFM